MQPGDYRGGTLGEVAMSEAGYEAVIALVREHAKPSASFVSRMLGIDYHEALDHLARMEREGLVTPPDIIGMRRWLGPVDLGAKVVQLAAYRRLKQGRIWRAQGR
jgi:DNA segregation ATPase FtsK/SpoIIIE-like protein